MGPNRNAHRALVIVLMLRVAKHILDLRLYLLEYCSQGRFDFRPVKGWVPAEFEALLSECLASDSARMATNIAKDVPVEGAEHASVERQMRELALVDCLLKLNQVRRQRVSLSLAIRSS